jgi:hypothetical protein
VYASAKALSLVASAAAAATLAVSAAALAAALAVEAAALAAALAVAARKQRPVASPIDRTRIHGMRDLRYVCEALTLGPKVTMTPPAKSRGSR